MEEERFRREIEAEIRRFFGPRAPVKRLTDSIMRIVRQHLGDDVPKPYQVEILSKKAETP